MKRLIILFSFLILLVLSGVLVYREGTLPVDKNNQLSKIFVIKKGQGLNEIVRSLQSEGLIRNKIVFYLIVKKLGIEKSIQAGDFRLSQSMNALEIAKNLTHGTLDIWITIIEGLRKEEIAQLISQNVGIPEIEFLKTAKEGYLFPDTYLIPIDANLTTVMSIIDANFARKFDADLQAQAKANSLTVDQALALASLVEKEAKYDADRQKVANIIAKRLKNEIPLQIDATIQYALGYQEDIKSWWKKELSFDDLKINSQYNTYKNPGLPPGPISNPGLASIRAAVNSDADTPYLYYVSDKNGLLHFAATLEEHNANIGKYLK